MLLTGTVCLLLLYAVSCSLAHLGYQHWPERHSRHNTRTADLEGPGCELDTDIMFVDLFKASSKTPWLLCAVESAMAKSRADSVAVLTDDWDQFHLKWPSQLPSPARLVSIHECLKDTPLRGWLDSPELATSTFQDQNVANALRLAAIYKSGGTYLDMDIIPLNKELLEPRLASIARQCNLPQGCGELDDEPFFLNNSFLSFAPKSSFLFSMMETFVAEFNGSMWGWNGPRLISAVYERLHCDSRAELMDPVCHDLTIVPKEQLAPFRWDEVMDVLRSQHEESYARLTTHTLGVHMYHNEWKNSCIPQHSMFHQIMLEHCPIVTASDDRMFC